jgi:hypothetical protein
MVVRMSTCPITSLTALPPADDIRRDSDLFLEGARTPEFQDRMQSAMKLGFQTRDAEMNLAQLVGEL